MIYVTHDQVEAMTMGDRIVVMKDGVIQQVDTPIQIYDHPANLFVAGFIGTPPMNLIRGVLRRPDGRWLFDAGAFQLPIADEYKDMIADLLDKDIILGLRPEHIGTPMAESVANAPKITATIQFVEPMGAETYLSLTVGQQGFVARVDPHRGWKINEQVSLAVLPNKFYFFNPESTRALN